MATTLGKLPSIGATSLAAMRPKAAGLPAWGMEISGNSVESAVRYAAWWCAVIGGNIGP
ncbi:hypothetical protein [Pseudochelatococcus contaminans]|uniref:Uncharacterized protein n=1 Tax=Pseudochelatococcus contaminans TaxID=1538103 RepID=A0A7W5Z5Q6_9HYPH|nr:hypothetical protein [Pseudochelatococcus contaminans]MBB3810612.1 hypothetical protein [Pseudochelatococcus contaminans]